MRQYFAVRDRHPRGAKSPAGDPIPGRLRLQPAQRHEELIHRGDRFAVVLVLGAAVVEEAVHLSLVPDDLAAVAGVLHRRREGFGRGKRNRGIHGWSLWRGRERERADFHSLTLAATKFEGFSIKTGFSVKT